MNEPSVIDESAEPSQKKRLIDNRAAILVMLFCVTGFLGIPVLVASRGFSVKEKILWSVLVTLYTSFLIAVTGGIVWWSYHQIRGALA